MPTFEAGKATDTTWLGKMDALAAKHHISISQRQSGKEVESGEVLELPIEVRSWEGALESLVKFMHELENTDDSSEHCTRSGSCRHRSSSESCCSVR